MKKLFVRKLHNEIHYYFNLSKFSMSKLQWAVISYVQRFYSFPVQNFARDGQNLQQEHSRHSTQICYSKDGNQELRAFANSSLPVWQWIICTQNTASNYSLLSNTIKKTTIHYYVYKTLKKFKCFHKTFMLIEKIHKNEF